MQIFYLNPWQFRFILFGYLNNKGLLNIKKHENNSPRPKVIHGMDSRVQKRTCGATSKGAQDRKYGVKGKDPCWKFVVELGDYRTEPEILAELLLSYPWVKLGRRNWVSGNAHLAAKGEISRALLAGLQTLNGKTCAFLPQGSGTRRTFILMGVPRCITEKLLLQDEQVQGAERMTRWDPVAQAGIW